MSKFTKGKWKNYINKCVYVLDKKNKFPRFIVDSVHGNTEEEAQANARLIAAAPEMYQLLDDIAEYIEATQKLQKDYLATEFFDYAIRAKELLARIDGEEQA